jgi:PAS domain S-box-containing protein
MPCRPTNGGRNAYHPDDKERVVKSVRSALEQKVDYWTEEYRYRRADGSVAHVIDRGYFIYDKDRNPLRMIGAMVDITSRVNLAEAEISLPSRNVSGWRVTCTIPSRRRCTA